MANTLIHIGFPKTGSTWFQQVFYPKISNWKYISRNNFRQQITNTGPFEFNGNNQNRTIFYERDSIICDEGIIGGNPFIAIDSLRRIKATFEKPRIVLFIRNQPEMLVSKYSQYVYKNKGTESARRFFSPDPRWHRIYNFHRFYPSQLFYHSIIAFLHELFGRENVFVYLFEEFASNPQEFIGAFAREHGLELSEGTIDFSPRNEGLRRGLYPLFRFLNIFTRYNRRDKYYLFHIPYWHEVGLRIYGWLNRFPIFGTKADLAALLGKKRSEELIDSYRVNNGELIPYFGRKRLEQFGYPLPSTD